MRNRFLLSILSYLIFWCPLNATTYFVAKNGNDSTGVGSESSPWLTITKGASILSAGDILYVKAGTYRETVTLDNAGLMGLPITIKAFPGDEGNVIISAATKLVDWKVCASADDCYGNSNYANIYYKDVGFAVYQLFQNGVRLQPARYPAKTATTSPSHSAENGGPGWCFPTSGDNSSPYNVFTDTGLRSFVDDYFNGSICHIKTANWYERMLEVTDFSAKTGVVTLSATTSQPIITQFGYYFTNVAAQIDEEGDWAYRAGVGESTGRVWIYSKGGAPTGIEVSERANNIILQGNADYNIIQNLTLSYASDVSLLLKDGAHSNTISNCTITYANHTGLYAGASNRTIVTYNTIQYAGHYGIFIRRFSKDTIIENNTILDTGVGSYSTGSQVEGAFGDDITYNSGSVTVTAGAGFPGTAIYIDGCRDASYPGYIESICYNTIQRCGYCGITLRCAGSGKYISYNLISDYCLSLSDGGGIYAWGPHDQEKTDTISYNFVLNGYGCSLGNNNSALGDTTQPEHTAGIYMDEGTDDYIIKNNTVVNARRSGIYLHFTQNIVVSDNIVYGCGTENGYYSAGIFVMGNDVVDNIVTLTGNIIFCAESDSMALGVMTVGYNNPKLKLCNNNYYLAPNTNKCIQYTYIINGWKHTYYTRSGWAAACGDDSLSLDWPEFNAANTNLSTSSSRIIVNPTNDTTTTILQTDYYDMYGTFYSGSVSLAPFTSVALIEAKDQPASYTLTIIAANGTVIKSPNKLSYNSGEIVTLTALPDTGYELVSWSGVLTGSLNPRTITMDGNKSVTANFGALGYSVNVSAMNGSILKIPDKSVYVSGEMVTLQAVAKNNYHFIGWGGHAAGSVNPLQLVVDGNKMVNASFAMNMAFADGMQENGIIGHWKLNNHEGTQNSDSAGLSQPAVLLHGATWGEFYENLAKDEFVTLAGGDDAIAIPMNRMNAQRGSVAIWVRWNSIIGSQYLFGHATISDNFTYTNWIQLSTIGRSLNARIGNTVIPGIASIELNRLTLITLTWDSVNYGIYINGQPFRIGEYTGLSTLDSIAFVGNNPASMSEGLEGEVEDIRLFNRALDYTEVRDLYFTYEAKEEVPFIKVLPLPLIGANESYLVYRAQNLPENANFISKNTLQWYPNLTMGNRYYEIYFTAGESELDRKVTILLEDKDLSESYKGFRREAERQSLIRPIYIAGDDYYSESGEYVAYSGGSGTKAAPYRIAMVSDWQELMTVSADWASHFILTADLDLAGIALSPVGTVAIPFTGVFDGNGHSLQNVMINLPDSGYVGLFGYLEQEAEVKNLGVLDCDIAGKLLVGAIVGHNYYGSIASCYSTGIIRGTSYGIGGIAGWNDSTITDSFSTCTVIGSSYVGGLVGGNGGMITSCYAMGKVNGTNDNVGGLAGYQEPDSSIINCYARGPVTSSNGYVGSVVGNNNGNLEFCYGTGVVSGPINVGGLVGSSDGSINSCFWDIETTGQTDSAGGTGRTTVEMQTLSAFTVAGWNFVDIWRMSVDVYPSLAWE